MDAEENIINDDVVKDADQPQDDAVPKTDNAPKNNWFKQPPRPPTLDPDIKLEYNMEECYKALSDQLDWTNPEGDRCSFDLSKPLPLKGRQGHLTVPAEYFFNNDLEYLKSENLERKYTTSITKTKAARLSKHDVYSTMKILSVISVKVDKQFGYGYLEKTMVKNTSNLMNQPRTRSEMWVGLLEKLGWKWEEEHVVMDLVKPAGNRNLPSPFCIAAPKNVAIKPGDEYAFLYISLRPGLVGETIGSVRIDL
ncbi:hypothetical protein Tco_0925150 [Tanacetum coccineum]|uniref:Uncharacterized protein n=1 Tax=Tanacetum coccineum TaxID=301880 RepID=A0ABQ5D613_9ASTR